MELRGTLWCAPLRSPVPCATSARCGCRRTAGGVGIGVGLRTAPRLSRTCRENSEPQRPQSQTHPLKYRLLDSAMSTWPARKSLTTDGNHTLRDGPKRRDLLRVSGNHLSRATTEPLALRYSLHCQAASGSLRNFAPSKSVLVLSIPQIACRSFRMTATRACRGFLPAAKSCS
jgi:hypothetical protein